MPKYTVSITLRVLGLFLTQSTAAGALGFDAAAARDPVDGALSLPWTLVKGKLREAWEELAGLDGAATASEIDRWLGVKAGNQEDAVSNERGATRSVEPDRGILVCSGFRATERPAGEQYARRFRIQIDSHSGSVERGALQVIEAPARAGEIIEFADDIHFRAANGLESTHIARQLKIGLSWICSVGAFHTMGFGRLEWVTVGEPVLQRSATKSLLRPSERIDINLQPQGPFCFAERGVRGNLFESVDFIPGGALKGAVAGQLEDQNSSLVRHLHRIRFSHAFPAADCGNRAVKHPKSVVAVKGYKLYDVIDCPTARLIEGEAPAFDADWKPQISAAVKGSYPWPDLKRELRVRTAIDKENRRAADEKLFAVESIVPAGRAWLGSIDLTAISDEQERRLAEEELTNILALPLGPLGKTKAYAKVTLAPALPLHPTARPDGCWALTLQSSAILANPDSLRPPEGQPPPDLFAEYKKVWLDLSGNALELVNFFSEEALAGGYYLHRRFQDHRNDYCPWLLTQPGSVFLLKPIKDEASITPLINDWLRFGLRLPKWAREQYSRSAEPDWKWCPYIRENGYGEVAANLHLDRPGIQVLRGEENDAKR